MDDTKLVISASTRWEHPPVNRQRSDRMYIPFAQSKPAMSWLQIIAYAGKVLLFGAFLASLFIVGTFL